MKLQDLQKLSKIDLQLNTNQLATESINVSYKCAKWINLLTEESIKFKAAQSEYDVTYRQRFEFYIYDYKYTVNAKDAKEIYLKSDKEVQAAEKNVEISKIKIKLIENTIKGLNQISFNIRNNIDMLKFLRGE